MTDLRINNHTSTYPFDTYNMASDISSDASFETIRDEMGASETPLPPDLEKNWKEYLKKIFGNFIHYRSAYAAKIIEKLTKGGIIDYNDVISFIEITKKTLELGDIKNRTMLDNLIKKLEGEKSIYEAYSKKLIDEKLSKISELIQGLRSHLLLSFLNPAERQQIEDAIKLLEQQQASLISLLDRSGTDIFKGFNDIEKAVSEIIAQAEALFDLYDGIPDDSDTAPIPDLPTPIRDIPLKDGETVRNQRPAGSRGLGMASGASNYLKAFFAFSQTCNKLITMNTDWGMQIAELQKAATKLSISGQETLNELIKTQVGKFNKDNKETVSAEISRLQGLMRTLQEDFAGYQKKLDTVMPIILEQPKNITKDLDKFLEAAKSILQLVTAYANFRI